MLSQSNLTHLCAAEFGSGDVAYLVALADGEFGIVRNGQPVGEERWARNQLPEGAKAFLNYVRLIRRRVTAAAQNPTIEPTAA